MCKKYWKTGTRYRWRCNREQIHNFVYAENVNSEMKTTDRNYNKMRERKLWHLKCRWLIYNCKCTTLLHEQHTCDFETTGMHGSLDWSSIETLTADKGWELRYGWRDSRIPAKLGGGGIEGGDFAQLTFNYRLRVQRDMRRSKWRWKVQGHFRIHRNRSWRTDTGVMMT